VNSLTKDTSRPISAGVWALGFVSMPTDIFSEMIHSLLPLFMVTNLGASATFRAGISCCALAWLILLARRKTIGAAHCNESP